MSQKCLEHYLLIDMAQRVRARSGKGQRNGMNIDHGVDLCPHVDQNDDQQQNQPQGNGIEQLSRQIAAALIEMVQHLHPPSGRSDGYDEDAQTSFKNPFRVPERDRPVVERYKHK